MNLHTDSGYDVLLHQLEKRCAGATFHYYPSPGNWGDALINEGTRQFFDENMLDCKVLARDWANQLKESASLPGAPLAVVGGGGGWCRNWGSTIRFVELLASLYENVLVLPTTFDDEFGPLSLDNVIYFSRDKHISGNNIFYCPDMAFYLTVPDLKEAIIDYPLLAFRRDKERNSESPILDRNWDLSLLGDSWTSSSILFEIISRFKVIYTDRLHVSIAAAMIGREVKLLDGNYQKNRRVYSASMENNFANVEFIEWLDFSERKIVGRDPIGKSAY